MTFYIKFKTEQQTAQIYKNINLIKKCKGTVHTRFRMAVALLGKKWYTSMEAACTDFTGNGNVPFPELGAKYTWTLWYFFYIPYTVYIYVDTAPIQYLIKTKIKNKLLIHHRRQNAKVAPFINSPSICTLCNLLLLNVGGTCNLPLTNVIWPSDDFEDEI